MFRIFVLYAIRQEAKGIFMRILILLSDVMLFSAGAAKAEFTVAGHEASTCAKFEKEYGAAPQVAEITYVTWAQGFMSGLNLNADKEKQRDFFGQSTIGA